jgi:hypothetical protein
LQLSNLFLIFVPSFVNNIRLHRGEQLSFDPSENLENSKYKGEKFGSRCKPKAEWNLLQLCSGDAQLIKAASPAVGYILLAPLRSQLTYITCRCELISFLLIRVFQDLQTKDVKKAHTLCASDKFLTKGKTI